MDGVKNALTINLCAKGIRKRLTLAVDDFSEMPETVWIETTADENLSMAPACSADERDKYSTAK